MEAMNSPIDIFKKHWVEAKASKDPNANLCMLATASQAGDVSTRTVVLREVTDSAFILFINSSSPKWQDLQENQSFELMVLWPALFQQYRIRGQAHKIPSAEMKQHWLQKPYSSKILDHYYTDYHPQSSIIHSREELLTGINALKEKYLEDKDIPYPDVATGVAIEANYMEVWHGSDSDRLHHRFLYELKSQVWSHQTLVP